jgi:ribonucleotide reductase beta subunit family protein with ferritin-like domain
MFKIFSKDGCKLCNEAQDMLKTFNLSFIVQKVNIQELKDICGSNVITYPQIFIDDNHLGDIFALEEYLENEFEPILAENSNRFTIFPLKYHNLWDLYKKAQMTIWTAEEIDLNIDTTDWKNLSDNERHFIKYVLAFFAASDGIVYENLNLNFSKEIQIPEVRSFYAYQEHNEMVHGETYSLLIDKYISDAQEKDTIFRAIETIPCIKKKASWAFKWFENSIPFCIRLIAFACIEGIFFSGSFCAIFWLKKRGLMPGLAFSNELISRDEALHLEFAVELFRMLKNKPTSDMVHELIKDAVEIEREFILEALPCKLIGMDSEKMSQYIEYVADRLLKQIGYTSIWNTENPFDFMENISLDGKTNFFEKRVGEYSKFSGQGEILFDEEF